MREPGTKNQPLKAPVIMVVDDDGAILNLLIRVLEPEGYSVIPAADGQSALALMEKCQPDLLILDITMPVINGLQVLSRVRQRFDMPVIMLTANQEDTVMQAARIVGADDYVIKPFSTNDLLARVRANLRRAVSEGHS
ncbi:MAG: response regulator [Dehalococcoidales bacterium]|nr:response regulator [Dehalococcoidales bacterium]